MGTLTKWEWSIKKLLNYKILSDLLENFLAGFLKEDIKIIELLEEESNRLSKYNKQCFAILLAEKSNKERIIVEMKQDCIMTKDVNKANEEWYITKLSKAEMKEYDCFFDNWRQIVSEIKTSWYDGWFEGRNEGIEQVIQERDTEIVLNAFNNNLPIDILCKISDLSTNKITTILKKNKISPEKINTYIEK